MNTAATTGGGWRPRRQWRATAAAVVCACAVARGVEPAAGQPAQSDTVVIVHSYSGSNATLGAEIARMLGARLFVYHDPPADLINARAVAPLLAQMDLAGATRGATRVLFGFPIWGESPTPFAFEALSKLDVRGRRVTFFFSHIHYANPQPLARLRSIAEAGGATVTEPLPFLMPLGVSDDRRRQLAQQAILARPDLWQDPTATPAQASCDARHPRTGAALCAVPAGFTWIGSDGTAASDIGARPPTHQAVGPFDILRSEVTIAEWQACEAAGACPRIALDVDPCRILRRFDPVAPMPCVDLVNARAYCSWADMRVPSEAEWTRAARADSNATYPWGNEDPRTGLPRGNFGDAPGHGLRGYEIAPETWPLDGQAGLAPVCSFKDGNSPFGVCDLAGNLYEWVESDFCGPASGPRAMLKGGSWVDGDLTALRVATHGCFYKDNGFYLTGFRCARSR